MRSERFEDIRQDLEKEHSERTQTWLPLRFDEAMPWNAAFAAAVADSTFWDKEVTDNALKYRLQLKSRSELQDDGIAQPNLGPKSSSAQVILD